MSRYSLAKTSFYIALAMGGAHCSAADFSNIYFFGDSLTDSGAFASANLNGKSLKQHAKWNLDNLPNQAEVLGQKLGLTVTPNNMVLGKTVKTHLNGNNYAEGGAMSIDGAPATNGLSVANLPEQVNSYLKQHQNKANGDALYFVWSGGNDIPAAAQAGITALVQDKSKLESAMAAQAVIQKTSQGQLSEIKTLTQAGAQHFLVPNLPDFGATPAVLFATLQNYIKASHGAISDAQMKAAMAAAWQGLSTTASNTPEKREAAIQAALTNAAKAMGPAGNADKLKGLYQQTRTALSVLTDVYNHEIDMGMASTGANVMRANTHLLFNELLAHPEKFGIKNTSGSVCTPSAEGSLTCESSALTTPLKDKLSYVFSDDRHPSPAVQEMIGEYYYSLITSPQFADLAGQIAAHSQDFTQQSINTAARQWLQTPHKSNAVNAFAIGGYQQQDLSNQDKIKSDYNLIAGLQLQLTPQWMTGFAFTEARNKADLSQLGEVKNHVNLMTATLGYANNGIWAHGDLSVGKALLHTTRQIQIGPMSRTESARNRATLIGMNLEAGMNFDVAQVSTGPIIGWRYNQTKLGSLTEMGRDSTAMQFGKQTRKSEILSLGWQVQAKSGMIQPYASLAFNQQLKKAAPTITAHLVTMPSVYQTEGNTPDKHWMDWKIGSVAKLSSSLQVFAELSGTQGSASHQASALNIGLNKSF